LGEFIILLRVLDAARPVVWQIHQLLRKCLGEGVRLGECVFS
jgi:hypothetical protein